MKLVRPIFALLFLLSLTTGLYAFQRGFDRRDSYYSMGPRYPSEFYWTRLQYTSGYANGSHLRVSAVPRRLDAGFSQGR